MQELSLTGRAHASGGSLQFETFFADEYPRLVRALTLVTGNRVEAEELAQEALTRTYERWDRVQHMESPVGYVYRTALNLNHRRMRRLFKRSLAQLSPSDDVETAETKSDVLAAMRSLPLGGREALVLHDWMGLSSAEAGELLGIDAASVRSRLHRARQQLSERLGEDYG